MWGQRATSGIKFRQSCKKAGFIAKSRTGVVVRMATFPIRQDHDAWRLFPKHPHDLQSIVVRVFHAAIGDVERHPPADLKNPGGLLRFGSSALCVTTRAKF